MSGPLVKVCCIISLTEAKMALRAGADFLGLVSEMPSGPGVISLAEIARIVGALPALTKTILLTSKGTSQDIFYQHNQVKTWGLQLVDELPEIELIKLRKTIPQAHLTQVIHVSRQDSISEALRYEKLVDSLLLDSGKPRAKMKTLGGTGETHDWNICRDICAKSSLPVFWQAG